MDLFKLSSCFVLVLCLCSEAFCTIPTCCTVQVIKPDYSNYVYPCSKNDLNCLREFFCSQGFCSSVSATEQCCPYQPAYFKNVISEIPTEDTTIISSLTVIGLQNGNVTELYYNKVTGVMVMTIEFENIKVSEYATFYKHRYEEEDMIIKVPDMTEYYVVVATTTQTSGCNMFSPCNTVTTTKVLPSSYNINGLECVTDLEALAFFADLNSPSNAYSNLHELNLARGQLYVNFFIKNVICNPNIC